MEKDMTQMMAMMKEMNASILGLAAEMHTSIQGLTVEMHTSIQGLTVEMRDSMKGLEGRFDGLETRFDGLEGRFKGLAMEFLRSEHQLTKKFEASVEETRDIYRLAESAAVSADVSAKKAISHGPMIIDHEDRIRFLEGKRKTPPSV